MNYKKLLRGLILTLPVVIAGVAIYAAWGYVSAWQFWLYAGLLVPAVASLYINAE